MIHRVLIAILLILSGCSNRQTKVEGFSPSWKVGDYRMFNEKGNYFIKVANDTISYITYDKTLKITVSSEDSDGYILLVESQPSKEFNFYTDVDSIKSVATNIITQIKDIFKDFGKFRIPYRLRVNKTGEIIGVQDFDDYFIKFMDQIFKIKDTIDISEDRKQALKMLSQNNNGKGFKERLSQVLIKEVSDYFNLYGVKNPKDNDIVEHGSDVDQSTGEQRIATMTYHNVSINEGIQEIDLTVKYEDSLRELIGSDSIKKHSRKEVGPNDMNNLTKYRYDTKTGWLESIVSNIHYLTDSSEMRLSSDVRVYK